MERFLHRRLVWLSMMLGCGSIFPCYGSASAQDVCKVAFRLAAPFQMAAQPENVDERVSSESPNSSDVTPKAGNDTPPSDLPVEPPNAPTESATAVQPMSPISDLKASFALAEDLLTLHELYERYVAEGGVDPAITALFATKDEELSKKSPPIPINDYFQIKAFDWHAVQVDSTGSDAVTVAATFLVVKNSLLELPSGQKLGMFMRLVPDKSHLHYFSGKQRSGIDFMIPTDISNDEWKMGEAHLFRRRFTVPPLPYRLYFWFTVFDQNGQYLERLGGQTAGLANLGWHVALPDEDTPEHTAEEQSEAAAIEESASGESDAPPVELR